MSRPSGTPPLSQSGSTRLAREPIVVTNLLGALVLEVCVLLRAFGVPMTDGQQNAINAIAGLLILIASALVARRATTPLINPRDEFGRSLTPDSFPPAPGDPIGGAHSRE